MTSITVDGITFEFPEGWLVDQFDEWAFYRNHFQGLRDGLKAIDLIAIHKKSLYLIEVKDYSIHARTKPIDLVDEVRDKVIATLSALFPAKISPLAISEEQNFAKSALECTRLKIVLHLEQPYHPSRQRPPITDLAVIEQSLKQKMRPLDLRPQVTSSKNMHNLPWKVFK